MSLIFIDMSKFIPYLEKLRFDPQLLSRWNARYLSNIRIVLLIIFVILAVGITSILTLPRRLNPEIKLTIVSVTTVLPGASPADIESLITIPLEDKLRGLNGLDTITSVSSENVSNIMMQFLSGVDKDKARSDAQTAVSSVTNLPKDAKTPTVTAFDFENQPIWSFTLTTKSDVATLMRFADSLKTKIEDQPHVDHVALDGFETQEIQVVVDENKIREYNLNPLSVSQAINNATQAFPAGSLDTGKSFFSLAIDTQSASIEDLRNIHLNIGGQPLKLGDIAEISRRSKPNQNKVFIASPNGQTQNGVNFSIYKTSSADIDKTVKDVEGFVKQTINETNGQFQIETINNAGELISKQFTDLIGEFQSTLILVFINLFLFLGLRQALIAIMTIPLTFLLSFTWMNLTGQSINFISLFALLLAFGTSIDDTIVTVSAMTTYYRTGKFSSFQTGLLVWRDFIVPIWTTTVTTVWAFLPLILSSGILGEFIKPIPLVVAATMYSSTFIAWFITLPSIIVLLKPQIPRRVKILFATIGLLILFALIMIISPKNIFIVPIMIVFIIFMVVTFKIRSLLLERINRRLNRNNQLKGVGIFLSRVLERGLINTEKLGGSYQHLISRILNSKRGRRITMACIILFTLSSYLLIPTGLVKNEFFPKVNADTLYINFEMPTGTDLKIVENETKSLLEEFKKTPKLQAAVAQTGAAISAGSNFTSQNNSSLFTLLLVPKEKRNLDSSTIAVGLRQKFENYTKGKILVIEESSGPPAGADLQIKISGEDLKTLDDIANKVITYLKNQPGVINVDKSIKGGVSKISFIPDKAKLAQNNITLDSIGLWLRLHASGFNINSVRFDNKSEDVVFYDSTGNQTPESLGRLSIQTQNSSVPLLSLGRLELENNPTVITREAGKRTISVSASIMPGYSLSDTNKKLENFADTKLDLPSGYNWKTGGVNEENQKSVNSILQAMGLSFLLIMATMVVEFGSYRQAAMILSLIPFAISGVFIIFALTGTPLSFPALIGVMALFGVVVTNAMFIMEKINQNRKQGMALTDAISDAAQSRLEPIMLTSLTSILGLVPITIANPLWRGLGGAIISGLMFSGLIMLFFIPIMYYIVYRGEEK